MVRLVAGLTVFLSVAYACMLPAAEKKEEKITKRSIKEVMKLAHKPSDLLRKVAQGKASKEEKEELVKLYKALAQNKPPRGEKADWDKRTAALTLAAEAAVRGDKDAAKKLTKAGDCMACHKAHK